MVKHIGILAIMAIAVGTLVAIIFGPILEMLGLCGVREYFDSIGGLGTVTSGIAGAICGLIGVWYMAKNTDLFS